MSHKRLSIADLAKELGLAASTVSRALAGSPQVSEATTERVRKLAEEWHYKPNQLAAALRKGHSQTLGVLVPHLTGQFFPEVVNGIALEASRAGFNVMICQSNEDEGQEKKNIDLLMNARVEGILVSLANTTQNFAHFEAVRDQQVPLVFFDREMERLVGDQVRSVVLDDAAGAYAAVSHLLKGGRRRIAHMSGPLHLNIHKNRHAGYLKALRDHHVPFREELVIISDLTQETGVHDMEQLLALPERPDAVFASTDLAIVGALQTIKRHGLRVPQDVALAGFSNELFTALTEPTLTSVDQQCKQMGEVAVQVLLELLNKPAQAAHGERRIVLTPQLLVRESSQ
jgi:LacI family transcriptional regulator